MKTVISPLYSYSFALCFPFLPPFLSTRLIFVFHFLSSPPLIFTFLFSPVLSSSCFLSLLLLLSLFSFPLLPPPLSSLSSIQWIFPFGFFFFVPSPLLSYSLLFFLFLFFPSSIIFLPFLFTSPLSCCYPLFSAILVFPSTLFHSFPFLSLPYLFFSSLLILHRSNFIGRALENQFQEIKLVSFYSSVIKTAALSQLLSYLCVCICVCVFEL